MTQDASRDEPEKLLATIDRILHDLRRDHPPDKTLEGLTRSLAECSGLSWSAAVLCEDGRLRWSFGAGAAVAEDRAAEVLLALEGRDAGAGRVLAWEDGALYAAGFGLAEGRSGFLLAFGVVDRERVFLERLGLLANLLTVFVDRDHLRSEERRLARRNRSLIEALPHCVYEQQLDGQLLSISPMIADLVGFEPQVYTDECRIEDLIHERDRGRYQTKLAELRRRINEGGAGLEEVLRRRHVIELRLIHRNGRDIVWVADHFVLRHRNPYQQPETPTAEDFQITGVLVDLGERKRLEIEALQLSRLRTIGEIASGVAHEINNPLTAVLTYGQLLERWLQDLDLSEEVRGKGSGYLKKINDQAKVIFEITRNLTGFVRKGSSEDYRAVNAGSLIESSLSIFSYALKKERIALAIEVPVNLPPFRARSSQIRQVILNLVSNARASINDLPEDQTGRRRIRITAARQGADRIRTTVHDEGAGIAPENLEKIFDAFFSTRSEGTGLGLSIARRIVEEHGGELGVEPGRERGAAFYFDLPLWRAGEI